MLEGGNGSVAAAQAEVQFGGNGFDFKTFGYLFLKSGEEGVERGEADFDFRMLLTPCHEVFDLAGRRAAAMITKAEAHGDVDAFAVFDALQCAVEFGDDGRPFTTIPIGIESRGKNGRSAIADPAEDVVLQREEMVVRTREGEVFKARRRIDFRHAFAMAERIRRPCDQRFDAKLLLEIFAADGELAEEIDGGRHVLVRLDPSAADGAPASCRHKFLDTSKEAWIGLLDVVVDGGFAAVEGEFRKAVHELDDRAAGFDAFVEAFMLVPEPDGIEMGVRQDVEDFFHGWHGVG